LTAGLFAKKMGLPVKQFLAATNNNNTVPNYLLSGNYNPMASLATISNAMDVGDPSNFVRMEALYGAEGSTWNNMKKDVTGFSYGDEETKQAMIELNNLFNYTPDPHGAIGYLACKDYLQNNDNSHCIFLETAHPGKFSEVVNATLGEKIDLPSKLESFMKQTKEAMTCYNDYNSFKNLLLDL